MKSLGGITLSVLVCYVMLLAGCQSRSDSSDDYPWNGEWDVVFFDDFNGTELDPSSWTAITRGAAWNNENQAYDPSNADVLGGQLVLTSRRESWTGPANCPGHPEDGTDVTREFTSAQVQSRGKKDWLYGRFECRARMGLTPGMLCAVWMVPADLSWPPEIDIAEVLDGNEANENPGRLYMTSHYGSSSDPRRNSGYFDTGANLTGDWHIYAVEWEPGVIRWYLDGIERFRTTEGVPDKPFYFILCPAIGPDWTGDPGESSSFPVEMLVDWVRVSQRARD
jgi:beta-glucanase (GH16 family)